MAITLSSQGPQDAGWVMSAPGMGENEVWICPRTHSWGQDRPLVSQSVFQALTQKVVGSNPHPPPSLVACDIQHVLASP